MGWGVKQSLRRHCARSGQLQVRLDVLGPYLRSSLVRHWFNSYNSKDIQVLSGGVPVTGDFTHSLRTSALHRTCRGLGIARGLFAADSISATGIKQGAWLEFCEWWTVNSL